jgi:hypothetical protein
MKPWYFFSYARANKHKYLEKFHNDLWEVLQQKLTAIEQQQHVSFSDWQRLELMSRWALHLEEALEWSCVLVCITSPAYITQEWCGRELGFFEQMSNHHYGPASERILPVIWSKADLPSAIKTYEYTHASLPDEYSEIGIFRLIMKYGRRGLYWKCVDAMAQTIYEKGTKSPGRGPVPGLKLVQMPSAFQVKDKPRTKVVYCSLGGRSKWQPFLPPPEQDGQVQELVETVIARRQIGHDELTVGPQFAAEVDQCSKAGEPVLILMDPSVAPSPQRFAPVFDLNKERHRTTALFVPWNEQDPLIQAHRDEMKTALAELTPRIAAVNPLVSTPKDLQSELNATLEKFQQMATNRNVEGRTAVDQLPRVSGAG